MTLFIGPSLFLFTPHRRLQIVSSFAGLIGLRASRREFQVAIEIFEQCGVVPQLDMDVCQDQIHGGIVRHQVPSLDGALLGLLRPLERQRAPALSTWPCHEAASSATPSRERTSASGNRLELLSRPANRNKASEYWPELSAVDCRIASSH